MFPKGSAFWLANTGGRLDPGASHLFCVLTEPCAQGEQILVNMTGINAHAPFDTTCVLDLGDHPRITKASYILYERTRPVTQKMYDAWKIGRQIKHVEDWPLATFERIRAGLSLSPFSTPKMKTYFEANKHL